MYIINLLIIKLNILIINKVKIKLKFNIYIYYSELF